MKNFKLILISALSLYYSVLNAQYITPNAGATQTFNVSTNGLIFTDPTDGVTGGPGGVCTTTSSGNPGDYPNCGCTTVTTICAPVGQTVSANFTSFNIFGNFDILKIFNGSNVSAPQIYDSNLNANTDNLAGMIAANGSSTFTSVGQNCLTFEFYATTVVNSCGWEAGITTSGGGGPNPPSTSLSCAGNALDFDGVNDRVTYPNGTAALVGSNFTISGWVYPKSNTNFHQGYFGWRNNTNADFYILQLDHSTNIEARFRNSGGTNFDLSTTVTLNTWQHLAMSYDGTTLKLYKNGVLVASRAANGNLTNAAVPLDIGALVFQGSYFYLNGILDEVSYWNNTRTDAQILAMFNAPTPVSAGLAALYRFNQGIAGGNNIGINTALDGSGNNRTASLSSFSLTGATSNWVQSGNFYGTFNAGIAIVENSGVPNDGVVEPGSSVTLTASGGNTYLWSTGSTNSSINVTPSVTTTYSVTITNNQGCVGVATVTITVKNANPCLLVCSGDQTISLGGGQCQYQIPNLVTGILNDCSVEIVQISKVGAGDYVGAGKYELVYKLRDKKTQFFLDSCKFTLTVKTYQPTNATLVCNDHVNISADENCIVSLNADMFLEGGPYKCYDDYKIIIWPFKSKANAYEIQQHTGLSIPLGEHTYEIVDPETGNRCWGTFTIEDKLAPTVSCNCVDDPTQVVYVTSLVDPNGNILDVNSPIFNRPTGTTPALCNPTGTTGGRRYKAFEFEVSVTGSYTFNSNLSNGDGYGLIYEDFFDPTQPCLNFITANDDGAGDLDPLITVTLTKGKKYIYVYSLFSGPTTYSTGFFINITATPTGGQVLINNNPANAPECKFKCYDLAVVQKETVDKLYGQSNDKSVLTTPPSASDGCSNVDKSFEDQVITDKCGDSKLIRDWTFKDSNGNVSYCTQTFTFEAIEIADLTPPTDVVIYNCGLNTSPESIAAYFDKDSRAGTSTTTNIGGYFDDYGQTPDVVELHEGFKEAYFTYQQKGYDGKFHDQKVYPDLCNIFVTYSDDMFPACGLGCGGNMKVLRTWKLLDWCTKEIVEYVQIIKASDSKPPTFGVMDVTVSVDPWECKADWNVLKPWELQDNCAKPEELKWGIKAPKGTKISGVFPNFVLNNLPKGVHEVTYWAEDCCGNREEKIAIVTVIDGTGPVADAKQNIVMSLTGGNNSGDGIAKLFAFQVDNGSYDQCTDVKLEIRRLDGGACQNIGKDGKYNNNATYNDHNGLTSATPGVSWLHPDDNVNDSDGGNYVKFCCDDIPQGEEFGIHQVELRVWDDGNMNGIIGDNFIVNGVKDNYNTTWADIRVENKIPPQIVCPPDVTVTCDMVLNLSIGVDTWIDTVDLTMTGYPKSIGICNGAKVTYKDAGNLDDCNRGTITRTFTATIGGKTATCTHKITVGYIQVPFTVTFPSEGQLSQWEKCSFDLTDARNSNDPKIKKPIVNYGQCDIVGENIKIDTFLFEDGACKKWKVSYTYKNWCTGEEKGPYVYYYAFKDVIAPELVCTDKVFPATPPSPQNPLGGCEGSVVLTSTASDALVCAEESWIKWQVFFDGWSNGTVDRLGSSFVNKAWKDRWEKVDRFINGAPNPVWTALQAQHPGVVLADPVYVTYIKPTKASGEEVKLPAFTLPAENIEHKILWKVTDGCGNVDQCNSTVKVVDQKAPTPYCVHISTAIMQTNPKMVELWAKDFDKGAFDNCTPQNKLYFTFDEIYPVFSKLNQEHYFKAKAGQKEGVDATLAEYNQGKAQKWIPSLRSSGKIWTSAGVTNIKVSVWDESWNTDFCEVELKIIDNGTGGSRASISGTVATATGERVSDATVTLDAGVIEYPKSVNTDVNGNYVAGENPVSVDYTVSASKGGDYDNGVTTLDLVIIQRHILGMESLNDNYKVIAADANNDSRVTAQDLSELRKLILGVTNKFANESWRFPVTGATVNTNPISFTEGIQINGLSGDVFGQNFVAVKIGDVNGSVDLSAKGNSVEARSNDKVSLSIAEANVAAGELVTIPVTASNFVNVSGFQYTMNLNGASFVSIEKGALDMSTANVGNLGNGVVTMSYAGSEGVTLNEGEVLFTMVVRGDKASKVSEIFSMTSAVTKAESYNSDLKVGAISLEVRKAPVASIELYQNEPNPFKGQTTVSFMMPEAGAATLSVYDVTGKLVVTRSISAVKGLNSEVFAKDQLGVSGVMYYTLESGDFTATKKMIIVE